MYNEETNWSLNVEIELKISGKENIHVDLLRNLQLLYMDFKFRFILEIIGVLGNVTQLEYQS